MLCSLFALLFSCQVAIQSIFSDPCHSCALATNECISAALQCSSDSDMTAARLARSQAANAVLSQVSLTKGRSIKVWQVESQPCRSENALTRFIRRCCVSSILVNLVSRSYHCISKFPTDTNGRIFLSWPMNEAALKAPLGSSSIHCILSLFDFLL